jgi:putative membrane protein
MVFSDAQTGQLNAQTRHFEETTGAQIVVAAVDKSDAYPEIPWKAFAMGASAASLILLAFAVTGANDWQPLSLWICLTFPLFAGACSAVLSIFSPAMARCFLDSTRAEGETEQFAKSFFLDRELFGTPDRSGVLVLVSRFEHRVVILPDSGIAARRPHRALIPVVNAMTAQLRRSNAFEALAEGIRVLEKTLLEAGFQGAPGAPDTIPDELMQPGGDNR